MTFFFFPLFKVPCNATTTCSGHGSCSIDGDCKCDSGFFAANCSGNFIWIIQSSKYFLKFKWFVWIVECNAAQNCSSQGICGPDGACDCDHPFYGDNCTSKLRNICDEYLVHFKTNIFISIFFRSCMSLSLHM